MIDFGLARTYPPRFFQKPQPQFEHLQKGLALGTEGYSPPEQYRGEASPAGDIYALGATFYHMVVGKVPFEGSNPSAVMHKHLKDRLVPPDHLNTALSTGIGEIIEVMMSKKREDRYPSTKELIADLESVVAGEPPFQARKKYDPALLKTLASSGVTIRSATADDLIITDEAGNGSLTILLLALALGISILLNIAQAILS